MTLEQREEVRERARKLMEACRKLHRELAIAYEWDVPELEVAPEGWNEEANKKRLWKMFR